MPVELSSLIRPADTRIVLVVVDGLGGFATATRGSELEEAHTPNLDRLAAEGSTGLLEPVGPGITPGSGPSHLALFGYDPVQYELGRGALSAAGLGVELKPGEVAARGNLARIGADGTVTDRRAGRPADEVARETVARLAARVSIEGAEVQLVHESGHRVLVVFRGPNLDHNLTDTDPQAVGEAPRPAHPKNATAEHTAEVVAEFDRQVREILADDPVANGLLLRGFDSQSELPAMQARYGLEPAAAAIYPMYQGVAKIVGMTVLDLPQHPTPKHQAAAVGDHWRDYSYFFVHHKSADSAGEDGDFDAKVAAIEAIDPIVPDLVALEPDVLMVTGDHSTPSQMAAHSWHPVPLVMWGDRVGRDEVTAFGERHCLHGALGRRPTVELMTLALAAAGRLAKYGA